MGVSTLLLAAAMLLPLLAGGLLAALELSGQHDEQLAGANRASVRCGRNRRAKKGRRR